MGPKLGQKAPKFSLPDADNNMRSLDEFLGQGPAVLAFFPFAFSGVCDKEMCTFRDGFGALQEAKASLIGISVDSVYALRAFARTYNLRFPLLSDFNKKVTKLYGVLQDSWAGFDYRGMAKRSVFVIDSRGMLRHKWVADSPSNEPPYQEVLRAAEKASSQPSIFIRAKGSASRR